MTPHDSTMHNLYEEALLDVSVDADDIIHLTVGGDVTDDHMGEFNAWIERVKKTVVEVAAKNPGNVRFLIDVTQLEQFDIQTTKAVHDLMIFNRPYVKKTAVYGANYLASVMLEAVIALTKRRNMKLFPTRTDAEAWLSAETSTETGEQTSEQ